MSVAAHENFTDNGFFQAGGTLKADVPSYVERPADQELYQSILAGDYCYILTPRQMGKSSLMTRTAARLRGEGHHVAVMDLTGIGGHAESITADQWYYGLAHRLLRELDINFPLAEWWQDQALLPPLQRLMNFFEEGILSQVDGRVVVFVDEIDTTIKLPFSDDFFAAIRACFNARANDSRFGRLSFILLGVASPADLIRDPTRTPFNIGKRIDLTDFSDWEARVFLQGLADQGEQAQSLLTRILRWTGGHPYLTQRMCVQVLGKTAWDDPPDTRVDQLVDAEFFSDARRTKEDHLKIVHEHIAQAAERSNILKTYAKVLKGKPVHYQPQSPTHAALQLSGLVKTDKQGRLVVRNRIYRRVFDARWIRSLWPPRWKQPVALGTLVLSAIVFGWWIGAQQLTVRLGISIILAWLGIAYPEPEMVEIPAGSFLMGSPPTEKGRGNDEDQKKVSINREFSMGMYEVTFDEYDVFAFLIKLDGGCADGHEVIWPSDNGLGRGKMPVINVSWQDAQCYAEWLAKKTGKSYRLPTEAEWEYAARAGTHTAYPWGNEVTHDKANYGTEECCDGLVRGKDKWLYTSPVGSFPPNKWGLYDMAGNVWEWTCSDYVAHYDGNEQQCHRNDSSSSIRSLRGGSLDNGSAVIRSASRYRFVATNRRYVLGFRLVISPYPNIDSHTPPPSSPCNDTTLVPSPPIISIPDIIMTTIKGGCFLMGSPETEPGRGQDERQHQVCVKDFEIGKYEVTQAIWQAVMDNNPSNCKGNNLPVESVSWNDVQEFIKKLNQSTGKKYRLPTEAEWEYAVRAGTTTPFYTGNCINTQQANFNGKNYNDCSKGVSKDRIVAIGSYQPNGWGLYDMVGNVFEWTCSVYDKDYNGSETLCNSDNTTVKMLAIRGGSYFWDVKFLRSANRHKLDANYHDINFGFRLARDVDE